MIDVPRLVAPVAEIVEDVRLQEFRGKAVVLGIAARLGDRVRGAVQAAHEGGPRPRAMERERSLIAEGVEHAPAGGMTRDRPVLRPLVEIETRLLPPLKVEPVLDPVDRHPARLPRTAGTGAHLERQPLQAADGRVVADNDLGRLHDLVEQRQQQADPLLHRQGLRLQHERVAELVDHDPGKIIGFRPYQAPEIGRRPCGRGACHRLSPTHRLDQRRAQEGFIQLHAPATQPPPDDLRPAVRDPGAQQPPASIAALDHLAVSLGRRKRLQLVSEHPGMPPERPRVGVGFELKDDGHSR